MKMSCTWLSALAALPVWTWICSAHPAEDAVRHGQPALALELLQAPDNTLPEAECAFWRGQALMRLGRMEEAAEAFYRVPDTHPLYAYAARGLLYCARRSRHINFVEVCAPLTASPHAEIAALAQTLLCEYQLRYTEQGDASGLAQLEKAAADTPELRPLVQLLGIHVRRQAGDYNGGIEYARMLEREGDLSPAMRQRVRLELAELYYAKEAAQPHDSPDAEDDGKGEETLIQFISSNPDSPLLETAFRRLYIHGAFRSSEYVREKLPEWAKDTVHSKRAALALYARHTEQRSTDEAANIASQAIGTLPGEPITRAILLEHVRRMVTEGKTAEAMQVLDTLPTDDSDAGRVLYLKAICRYAQAPESDEAMQLFLSSSKVADGTLHTPALVNALICAVKVGNEQVVADILSAPESDATRRELLLAHAGLVMQSRPDTARRELELVQHLNPSPRQSIDVLLDKALLDLPENPQAALDALSACSAELRSTWSDEQLLRYAALTEQALTATGRSADALLHSLYAESATLPRRKALALHMADLHAAAGQHRQALHVLLQLAAQQHGDEARDFTLLYAGHESSKLGNLTALKHAARLYAECARQGSPLAPRAIIEQAAILVRINRASEAFELLERLEQTHEQTLTPDERAHMQTVRADAYGLAQMPRDVDKALEACRAIGEMQGVSHAWRVRARLQHASLCARVHRYEEALDDYRAVLRAEGKRANPADEADSFIYYYAASGAVYQYIMLGRHDAAAGMAEYVAGWPVRNHVSEDKRGPKPEAFARWAQQIRQNYQLPRDTPLFSALYDD